jgi:hypothetical protein
VRTAYPQNFGVAVDLFEVKRNEDDEGNEDDGQDESHGKEPPLYQTKLPYTFEH